MPRHTNTPTPTASEMRILQVLWKMGDATVEQVVSAFPESDRPNYKTTQAFLRIMEQKGFVRHNVRGRVFVFEPLVSKEEVDRRSVGMLLQQNFSGSASGLLVNLLETRAIPVQDLDRIEARIREYRKQQTED